MNASELLFYNRMVDIEQEIIRLRTINAELLEALEAMVRTWDAYLSSPSGYPAYAKASAAIARAKGEA